MELNDFQTGHKSVTRKNEQQWNISEAKWGNNLGNYKKLM